MHPHRSHILSHLLLPICLLGCMLFFTSCEEKFTTDPAARLVFSVDTIRFDTVFTNMVTPTLKVTVRNPYKEALRLDAVRLQKGQYFHINVDGETREENLRGISLAGQDSIYIFIKANIDPQKENTPVLVEDAILFNFNNQQQALPIEAFGQNVRILRQAWIVEDMTLPADRPYLVYDYLAVDTACTVTIPAGTTIYMHDNAQIYVFGNLKVTGTVDKPVRVRGDRLDDMLVDVPYDYVSGRWGSFYLVQPEGATDSRQYDISYLEINSGVMGIVSLNDNTQQKNRLRLINSKIQNFAQYGLYLQNTDAEIANCEISNCASYCVYLAGGEHRFVHNTIASYFTGGNIQPVGREDVAAVYVNNLSKQAAKTTAFFYNNLIAGIRANNVVLATPLPDYYLGDFSYNYLRADSANANFANNVFYQENDTIFRNTQFTLERGYYNFQLDSVSPARGIGDNHWAQVYPLDRLGRPRPTDTAPDAGCYQWTPDSADNKITQ